MIFLLHISLLLVSTENGDREPCSLSGLMKDNLLRTGDHFVWKRRESTSEATLDNKGWLVTADGSRHKTPSGAAKHIVGRPVDGWLVWRSTRHNMSLDQIRKHGSSRVHRQEQHFDSSDE